MNLLAILYFLIPAYLSNMMPVFVKNIRFLDYPIDLGKTWRGRRILGSNKTWRGMFFGTIIGFFAFEIQRALYNAGVLKSLALINYSSAPVFLGVVLGFAALFGDSAKSFFKRRLNIIPGKPWVPFDQLDFIVVSLLLTLPWTNITLKDSLLAVLVIFFGTLLVQYAGYKLKLKKDVL